MPRSEAVAYLDPPPPIILSLKYVEYKNTGGSPVLSRVDTDKVTEGINRIYSQCQIQFKVEDYQEVVPEAHGLSYRLESLSHLEQIRSKFQAPDKLLVVNTGDWNHMTVGSPNAWTSLPGEKFLGAVIEAPVASFSGITAHELGHYLDLGHLENPENLMNPVIYEGSTALNAEQCAEMRDTAKTAFATALR